MKRPAAFAYGLLAGWFGYFFWLWPKLFYQTNAGIFASWRTIWADWSAHATFAAAFAHRPAAEWFKDHPLYYGISLNYPFLSSLISGGLERLGFSRVGSLLLPSMALTGMFIFALYRLYRETLNEQIWAALAFTLFFLGAGAGWLFYLADYYHSANYEFLKIYKEYSLLPERHIQAGGTIAHLWLPQRALELGMVWSVVALLGFLHLKTREERRVLPQIGLGISAGLLPWIHVHSLLAFGAFLFASFCLDRSLIKKMLPFTVAFAVTALLTMVFLHRGSFRQGFLEWYPGWLAPSEGIDFITFWLINWGPFLVLALLSCLHLGLDAFTLSGILLFAAANLVKFQPWDWDNTKLLVWAYLLLVPAVMRYLRLLWDVPSWVTRVPVILLFLSMTLTGFLDVKMLADATKTQYMMWSDKDLQRAAALERLVTPGAKAVVLTAPKVHDWVSGLAGEQILMGYPGWLMSYGIDYHQRERDIQDLFEGRAGAEKLLDSYHITHVVVDREAKEHYRVNVEFLKQFFTEVYGDDGIVLYQRTAR